MIKVTDTTPDDTLREFIVRKAPFTNSRRTFRGVPITPLDSVRIANHPGMKVALSEEAHLAFVLDEPDYVIWSEAVPIAWHSTTRKLENGHVDKHDKSKWEWVTGIVRSWPNSQTVKRYNKIARIIYGINHGQRE